MRFTLAPDLAGIVRPGVIWLDGAIVVEREARLNKWCRLLIKRYGVLFRELLSRESAAPSWH